MGSLLTYSGVTTKVKAMRSRLLTDEDYRELASFKCVPECAAFLRRHEGYADLLDAAGDMPLHRNDLENLLTYSLYRDYYKIYKFCDMKLRKFLGIYFIRYEVALLKTCLRSIFGHKDLFFDPSLLMEFFSRHSFLDMEALSKVSTIQELKDCLKDTPYSAVFARLDPSQAKLLDYENQLDLYCYKQLWVGLQKYTRKGEQKLITASFGSSMDLLNIQWIYRSKKYYRLSGPVIYSILIPVKYKLKPEQIKKLVDAESMEEFSAVLKTTPYAIVEGEFKERGMSLEDSSRVIEDKLHLAAGRKDPYSVATILSYLYFKGEEIRKLVTAIEGVRYGLDSNTIYRYIMNLKGTGGTVS